MPGAYNLIYLPDVFIYLRLLPVCGLYAPPKIDVVAQERQSKFYI